MIHPLFDLTGRVALVSGAASGLGRAISIGLAEFGADLMLVDIDPIGMNQTTERIRGLGQHAVPVVCDVTDLDQIRAAFGRLDEEYGKIDVLANVAGPSVRASPEEIPVEGIEYTLQALAVGASGR
jgi:gluconate 5-dehydrogenase